MANAKDKMDTSRRFEDLLQQFYEDDDEADFANVYFDFQAVDLIKETTVPVEPAKDVSVSKDTVDADVEEHHLSQKLSQLLAKEKQDDEPPQQHTILLKKRPSVKPPINTTKKIKTDNEKFENEIPKYLSANNRAFDNLCNPLLQKTATSMSIEDLRQVALLAHKMAVLELQILLWNTYLCSGTGTIAFGDEQPTANVSLSIWPEEVKSTMMSKGVTTATDVTAIDNDTSLSFVRKTLRDYNVRFKEYHAQLHQKVDSLHYFTADMQEAIVQFIEREGLASTQLQIKSKIVAVEYTYKDRMIELEFHQLNPNEHQLHVFENLTRANQEKITAKYDLMILKQRGVHSYLPESINTSQIPPPSSLNTISDQESRQHLSNRYMKTIEQAKSDMMAVYIASAESHMHECQVKFDTVLFQMKDDQDSGRTERRMSPAMMKVMERRFSNLSERFQKLHDLKMCVFTQTPIVIATTKQTIA